MTFSPQLQDLSPNFFQTVRLIATDMDGTLTHQGKFTPALLQALVDLANADVPVLIITGRSAGWVSGLVTYLPIVGAIAENGGLFYPANHPANLAKPRLLVDIPNLAAHRQRLAQMFHNLQADFSLIQESEDNPFRITDWTFDVQGLSVEDLQQMSDRCQSEGWSFTYSNVQCHIKPLQQDKANGLEQVLQQFFPEVDRTQVLTVGDSPNDESLFDGDRFPCSVGVANIHHYLDHLAHRPAHITQSAEVAGFCEVVRSILDGIH
jgi:HAD superfamily hydrolase (TIGR01484 family)